MYCVKCGKQIEDDALFCTGCGAPVNSEDDEKNVFSGLKDELEQKIKNPVLRSAVLKKFTAKTWISIGVAAVIVVAVIIIALSCSSGYESGYEGAVERFIDFAYYYERNEENTRAMAPYIFWQMWADVENNGDINEVFREIKEEFNDAEDKEKLKDRMVNKKIKYLTKLSEQECQQVEKALEETHNLNYSEITEGYSFKLELEIIQKSQYEKTEKKYNIVAVKMDSEWYLAVYGNNSLMWLVDNIT